MDFSFQNDERGSRGNELLDITYITVWHIDWVGAEIIQTSRILSFIDSNGKSYAKLSGLMKENAATCPVRYMNLLNVLH